MTPVNNKKFKKFIETNKLKPIQGMHFHQIDYVDNKGIIKATEESSSWGVETIYLIDKEFSENEITLEFVENLIKIKTI
jgi:hypothetical protein